MAKAAEPSATPFDDGAGSIRADRAVNPTLVFNETYADFVAAGTDPLHRIDLNVPSIDATTMTGSITTQRTAINVSGTRQILVVQISEPAGVTITVGTKNRNLTIGTNMTRTFPITISAPEVADGQYFASITLVLQGGGNSVFIPVAFVRKQGTVALTHVCSPTTVASKGLSHCTATVTNLGSLTANAALNIANQKGKALHYVNVATPGSVIGAGYGVQWSGSLTPQLPPQVTSITPTTGPDSGYLDLSLLGVGPIAGVGDDTITNFNVPTFYYGGESYTRLGVVSNGYLVVGGGDSSDIVFTPQSFPNAARPNNVLAPLWTDLNPSATGAGNIRIASLSGGGFTWVVVDYNGVKNFGNATTHSFEVWLQVSTGAHTGPSSEGITYSYGPNLSFPGDGPGLANAGSGDPDSGVNWGAENRDGSSGVNLVSAPANGAEYAVITAPPTAGGSVMILFDIWAGKPNIYRSVASMTSDQTPGITQVVVTLTVTP